MALHPQLEKRRESPVRPLVQNPTPNRYFASTPAPRKTRCDKLRDTKVPVTEEEYRRIRLIVLEQNAESVTQLAGRTVRSYLSLGLSLAKPKAIQTYTYIHVKLSETDHRELSRQAILANLNIRQCARSILEQAFKLI